MPSVVRPVVAVAFAVWGSAAVAQTFPALAKVKANAATVRGTAGEFSPEVGRLELGSRVTVVSAEGNDWLAIQPPAGSISWIPWTLVEPQTKPGPDGKLSTPFNAVVSADDGAAIRAGAVGENKPLAVQRTKLPKGTIVQVVGAKVKVRVDGDEQEMNWYPIIAPRDDVRFVRRADVEWAGAAPGAGFVVKAGGTTSKPLPGVQPEVTPSAGKSTGDFTLSVPNGERPQLPSTPAANKPADWPNNYPLWREAEKARGAGDGKQARELYTKLAQEVSREGAGQDLELANLCYDRIYNTLGSGGGGTNSGGNAGWRAPDVKAEAPKAEKAGRTATGGLVATHARLDGKWTLYLLTDERGVVQHYVISGGADLERHAGEWVKERGGGTRFTGKWVEVSGNEMRADGLRGEPVIVATDVRAK